MKKELKINERRRKRKSERRGSVSKQKQNETTQWCCDRNFRKRHKMLLSRGFTGMDFSFTQLKFVTNLTIEVYLLVLVFLRLHTY